MPVTDAQISLRRKEVDIYELNLQHQKETRIPRLSDDPVAAGQAVRFDSYLTRLNRFEKNVNFAMDHLNSAHDNLLTANDILQRLRDLSVQAAHGLYSQEDLKIMAMEVNQLLEELVKISNMLGPDTKQAFAGDKVFTEPFRIVEGNVEGAGEVMITRVEYRGAGATRQIEIGDNMFLELDISGAQAFWAEKMKIFSSVNATDYRVQQAGAFFINDVEIDVAVGDTLPSIVAKINDSGAPVKAYIDIDSRGLVIEGTMAELLRIEDKVGGASVMRDLGIIAGNMQNNAPNWAVSARVSGGSLFDMVIRLRDGMLRGDQDFIGSQGIAGIDLAINNINYRIADLSSRKERAEFAGSRLNSQIQNTQKMLAREAGFDLAQYAMQLKAAEGAHQSILATSARLLPMSLLNFLR